MLRSKAFDIPIICVGNLSTGGTGKSPHVLYLANWLSDEFTIGIISRGYGRKTNGYLEVRPESSTLEVGDEPLELKRNLPDIPIIVSEDRVLGIERMRKEYPSIDLVIMDDGFQHRAIEPGFSIILTTFASPFCTDHLLPAGDLREARSAAIRADLILLTKIPDEAVEWTDVAKKISAYTKAPVLGTSITYTGLKPVFSGASVDLDRIENCILITGVADASPIVGFLKKRMRILDHIEWPDHHTPSLKDLKDARRKIDNFAELYPIVITTEKDATRLISSSHKNVIQELPVHYLKMTIRPLNETELKRIILEHVRKDKSNS